MVSKKPSTSSSRAAAPTASTVPPSRLGLTNGEEIATFQRHQQIALSRANNNARTAAANGRVLVDASSLQLLANHFDHVMAGIQRRADLVSTCQIIFLVVCVYVLLLCLLELRVPEHASLVCLIAWSCDTYIPINHAYEAGIIY